MSDRSAYVLGALPRNVRQTLALLRFNLPPSALADHDYAVVYLGLLDDLENAGVGRLAGRDLLDLGCGQRFPSSLLAAHAGARVTALDVDDVGPAPLAAQTRALLRVDGVGRAVKTAVRRLALDGAYYRRLEQISGASLGTAAAIRFVRADPAAIQYELPGGAFDVIVANAVVEHVADLDGFAAEVARLLRPGGVFHAMIHNYYSLSGGHDLAWARPDRYRPRDVPPWDHLRGGIPAPYPLNRLRPEEYRAAFEHGLEVVAFEGRGAGHEVGCLEGEDLLGADLEKELAGYSRELLLTRAWCLMARKRA